MLTQSKADKFTGMLSLRVTDFPRIDHRPAYIDVWPGTPCNLAWLIAGRHTLGGGSSEYTQSDNGRFLAYIPS